MQKSKWLYSLIALLVVFISFSSLTGEYETEEDLIKAANKHFSKGEYTQCIELFSQLISNHPENPNYNYKYGTCLLFCSEDKGEAVKFLKFSSTKAGVDPEAFFYYGRALQLTYQFAPAKIQFQKFKSSVKPKVYQKYSTNLFIKQCSTAQKMIVDIQQIDVVAKKKVRKAEFFRSYRLGSMKRNILVTPPEFQSKLDKKDKSYSLIVHNPMNDVIYISSTNKKEGMGGKDIYKIQKMPDGTFSEPINVGPNVNTSMDEDYPYLHPNGRVLYFASKGHDGLGGYDIYKSELDTLVNLWGPAKNLGFAVNSPDDDIMYISDMDENIAYFASSRDNKQGDITVYKILPNSEYDPIVIVKGEVEIKGGTQHKAEITVYSETGEEIGVYNSQQLSGAFTMALEEDRVYTVGVSAPGKGEKKVSLSLPKKSVQDMVAKKFVIENNEVVLKDDPTALASSASKEKLLADLASLNVNQEKDVDFNTKVAKKKSKPKTIKVENPIQEETQIEEENLIEEEVDLIASAKNELEGIKIEKENLKKEIDATYFVAQKKKIKSNLIKDEIEELSTALNDEYDDGEKEKIKDQLNEKEIELKVAAAQATSALELAENKEKELVIKDKQIESANAYLKAVEKAENSSNSLKSIQDLEVARDDLDKIQNEIKMLKADDGSAEKLAKTDAARKNVADKEVAHDLIVSDLKDIGTEKNNLKEQINSSKNKGLKEELNLQVKELDEEEKQKKVEERVSKSQLTEAKSQLAVLESSNSISSEIISEIEDGSLAPISDEQKASIQKDVKETVAVIEKEQKEKAAIEATDIEENDNTVENAQEEIVKINELGKVTPQQEYNDEVKKAEIRKEELISIRDEKELLAITLASAETTRQKNSIQEKIDQLNVDEQQALEDVKLYVDQAKKKESSLSTEEKVATENKREDLIALASEVKKIESEKSTLLENEITTKPIELDVSTATDEEINAVLSETTNIKSFQSNDDNQSDEVVQLHASVKKKREEAVEILKEQKLAQIELEKKGGDNTDKVDELNKKAMATLFDASEIEGKANTTEFESKRKSLEEELKGDEKISTPELTAKAESINDSWKKASLRRVEANQSNDPTEKVRLINEAGDLERQSLLQQKELMVQIEEQKIKIENEKEIILVQEAEKKNVEELAEIPETPKVDSTVAQIDIQETQEPAVDTEKEDVLSYKNYNKENPTSNSISTANEKGYGIKRNDDFAYGPSPKANAEMEQAKALQNQAATKYYEAQELKAQALNNPDDAKKLNKQAEKRLKEGNKIQESANEKYQNVNAAELNYNEEEINFSLENDDIVKKDSAKIILKESKKIFEDAQEIRKLASKEKDSDKSTELVNQAYEMELEAISKQNYVLSGELDGEEESDIEEVVIVKIKREENDYTRKAKALRIKADLEQDENLKRKLFEEARLNDLAGNTKRTKRMQDALAADKIDFENNRNIVTTSREQSHNNTPANKAYKLEQEADSLFVLAAELELKAANNSDQIKRINQIEEASDLMSEAAEIQTYAIRKYQESMSAPDEPNFIADFRKGKTEDIPSESTPNSEIVAVDPVDEIENNIEEENIEEEIIEEEKKTIFSDTKVNNQVNNSIPEETLPIEEETIEEIPVQEITELKADPAQENQNLTQEEQVEVSYTKLTADAKEIEMQEVARVERIELLKNQSSTNKSKSEELLSTVDSMEDESQIMATIAQANELRDKAEKQEVEAKNEEIILKNNIAEGKAIRKEAELILGGVDAEKQNQILAKTENSSPELKKINEFLNNETIDTDSQVAISTQPEQIEKTDPVAEVDPINVEVEDPNDIDEQTANTEVQVPIGSSLLGSGSTEEQIMEDDFVMNSTKVYSSADEIPIDPGMPKGLIYQVQVGAFRNKIDPAIFNGLSPLVGELTPSGIIRYKVGYFRGFKSANMAKGRIRNIGYRDAFVVVFMDGKRITIEQADKVIEEAEDSEKFVYENLVADEVSKLKKLGITEEEGTEDPIDVSASQVVVNSNEFNENSTATSNTSNENTTVNSLDNGLSNDLLKVGGVFYTIQVGVFRSPRLRSDLKGVGPLMTEKLNNGLLRYTTGIYRDFNSANQRKTNVRNQGIKDAFIVAYNGTQKISTSAATELIGSSNANVSENSTTETSTNQAPLNQVKFMVQVGAYRTPIDPASTPVFKELTAYPVSNIETGSGLLIYMVGSYSTKSEADALRQTVIAAGGLDCFVVALQNGKRIPMREALELVK